MIATRTFGGDIGSSVGRVRSRALAIAAKGGQMLTGDRDEPIEVARAAVVPGVERQPLKKLDADEAALLKLLHRWRHEASQAGREIKRIVVTYEAGRAPGWRAPFHERRGVARTPSRED